ncbi:MAG: hypothetical protein GY796_29290, partial [Chloroflexi bacterium]|nr:hypothetical protein [Chloroflexota bacterium]
MKNILGKLLVFVTTAVCLLIVSSNVAAKRTTAVQSSSSNTVLYDGTAGGTPGTQNWLAYVVVGAATQAEVGGVTTLNTTLAGNGTYAGYPNNAAPNFGSYPAMNRQDGYELKFTVQLVTEIHANNDRAGFSVIMLGDDLEGIELGFWPNEIWAQHDDSSGSMFTHAEGVTFDTTAALTNYRLAFLNDSYTLYADDIPILTGLLRNYTNHIGPIDP